MTAPFPHHYHAKLSFGGTYPAGLDASPAPPLGGGPPLQFGGEDRWWSPEQLLLAAVNLCLLTTAQALAAKGGPVIAGYDSEAEGILEKTSAGIVFTKIILRVRLRVGPGDKGRAEALMASARKYCIVANSLKVPEEIELQVDEVKPEAL